MPRSRLQPDLSADVTVFVSTVGAASFPDCMAHLAAQDCTFRLEVIEGVAPLSAAHQRMLDRCATPYCIQVDEDMILRPSAVRRLYERMRTSPADVALVVGWLWDVHLGRRLVGVKIFRHAIACRYPFADVQSCDTDQLARMQADGYRWLGPKGPVLGLHGAHYGPRSVFERYSTLERKRLRRPAERAGFASWSADFYRRFQADPTEVNLMALMGVIAGRLSPDIGWGEKDYTRYDDLPGFAEAGAFMAACRGSAPVEQDTSSSSPVPDVDRVSSIRRLRSKFGNARNMLWDKGIRSSMRWRGLESPATVLRPPQTSSESRPASGSPVATIVMPLRSQVDGWLRSAVASALTQTVATEVIVVTSPDTSASNLAVLDEWQGFENLITIERPPGAGFAEAINLGFRTASCERVGLLLTDDWLSADAVERCLQHDADIVCTARQAYAADGVRRLWRGSADQAGFERLPGLQERASYLGHFLFFRRSAMLQAGGVDPTIGLTGAVDYDLVWTMLERGATVRVIPEALYHYRDHDGERLTLRDRGAQMVDLRKILAKHGVGPDETERLVAEKSRWYGVTGQTAIDDPPWYLGSAPSR